MIFFQSLVAPYKVATERESPAATPVTCITNDGRNLRRLTSNMVISAEVHSTWCGHIGSAKAVLCCMTWSFTELVGRLVLYSRWRVCTMLLTLDILSVYYYD